MNPTSDDQLASQRRGFLGMNVRGTPAMPSEDVRHDVELGTRRAGVLAFQEFRHRRYWLQLRTVMRAHQHPWRSFPRVAVGLARPVFAGQAIAWDHSLWRRRKVKRRKLHDGRAKISETRQLRAALLEDRTSGLACWFGTTHFVVGGDNAGDGLERRNMLANNLAVLDSFLSQLRATGHPIAFQLDANLRPTSAAWRPFLAVMRRHGGTIHGVRGVEYLFTINGQHVQLDVETDWIIPTRRLETDHEARGITFRLVAP